jgi:hypothetical protein
MKMVMKIMTSGERLFAIRQQVSFHSAGIIVQEPSYAKRRDAGRHPRQKIRSMLLIRSRFNQA